MEPEYKVLERTILEARKAEDAAMMKLNRIRSQCSHQWVERYDPIVTKGHEYVDPLAFYDRMIWVPEKTEPRWTRTCTVCGKVEHTKTTRIMAKTHNGLKTTQEIPDFGGV